MMRSERAVFIVAAAAFAFAGAALWSGQEAPLPPRLQLEVTLPESRASDQSTARKAAPVEPRREARPSPTRIVSTTFDDHAAEARSARHAEPSGAAGAPETIAVNAIVRDRSGAPMAGLPLQILRIDAGQPMETGGTSIWSGRAGAGGKLRTAIARGPVTSTLVLEAQLPVAKRPRVVLAGASAQPDTPVKDGEIALEVPELGSVALSFFDEIGRPLAEPAEARLIAIANPDEVADPASLGVPVAVEGAGGTLPLVPIGYRVRVQVQWPERLPAMAEFPGPVDRETPADIAVRAGPRTVVLVGAFAKGAEIAEAQQARFVLLDSFEREVYVSAFGLKTPGAFELMLPPDLDRGPIQALRVEATLEKTLHLAREAIVMPELPGRYDIGWLQLAPFEGKIRGQVYSAGRAPLAGGTAVLHPISPKGNPISVSLDATGRFALGTPGPLAEWSLQLRAPGHLPLETHGTGDAAELNLTLALAARYALEVLLPLDAPEGALAAQLIPAKSTNSAQRSARGRLLSRADGATRIRFELEQPPLENPEWALLASDGQEVMRAPATPLLASDVAPLTVDLRGRLVQASVQVLDAKGLPAHRALLWPLAPDGKARQPASTDAGGRAFLLLSQPGQLFEIQHEGSSSQVIALTGDAIVSLAAPIRLEIEGVNLGNLLQATADRRVLWTLRADRIREGNSQDQVQAFVPVQRRKTLVPGATSAEFSLPSPGLYRLTLDGRDAGLRPSLGVPFPSEFTEVMTIRVENSPSQRVLWRADAR